MHAVKVPFTEGTCQGLLYTPSKASRSNRPYVRATQATRRHRRDVCRGSEQDPWVSWPHPAGTRAYANPMVSRAFPVVYASNVERAARFWERLGFQRHFQLPADGEPGYVGLRSETSAAELAITSAQWAMDR